ncbi:DUF6207 family protein [Streptomyces afghaniensis]|uniref:DUF6207 family protein n=1 Tax=Streptomyces afghaniensis TaxID=66865 RepID=UPI0037BE139E
MAVVEVAAFDDRTAFATREMPAGRWATRQRTTLRRKAASPSVCSTGTLSPGTAPGGAECGRFAQSMNDLMTPRWRLGPPRSG